MSLELWLKKHSSASLEGENKGAKDGVPAGNGDPPLSDGLPGPVASPSSEELTDGGQGEESSSAEQTSPASEQLAEVSHLSTGSRPENEAEGVSPAGARSENESPSVPLKDEPYGVAEVVTPSGLEIYFQSGPERLYKVNGKPTVASMSGVCDILEKGGLPWWGMKIGVDGVLTLVANEVIRTDLEGRLLIQGDDGDWYPATLERIVGNSELGVKGLLTEHKLTVNHVRDQAGDRGTNVHTALELWAEKGILPQPDVYAPEEKGYVAGLREFLIDSGIEPVRSEVMVGSAKHKIAGRFDLDGNIPKNAEVVVKSFPKKKCIRAKMPGGLYRLDLKTSKDVYDTHFIQLEGYEECALESGYEPSLYRGVVHVTADGRYELRLNLEHYKWNDPDKDKRYLPRFEDGKRIVTFTDFKHVLAAYKALGRIKGRM